MRPISLSLLLLLTSSSFGATRMSIEVGPFTPNVRNIYGVDCSEWENSSLAWLGQDNITSPPHGSTWLSDFWVAHSELNGGPHLIKTAGRGWENGRFASKDNPQSWAIIEDGLLGPGQLRVEPIWIDDRQLTEVIEWNFYLETSRGCILEGIRVTGHAKLFFPGDANMDKRFSSADMVQVIHEWEVRNGADRALD